MVLFSNVSFWECLFLPYGKNQDDVTVDHDTARSIEAITVVPINA